MQFFLDTADIDDIKDLIPTGFVDGITTNPSLIKKSGRDIREVIAEICSIVPGPVSAEVIATDKDAMIEEGLSLQEIAPNIVIKVPLTRDGLFACKTFTNQGMKVNVTLCFSAAQALLAAKAGATYISPFVGRLDDISHDGLHLIDEIVTIYGQYDALTTEVLVASARHPLHVVESAKMGADVVTLPPKLLRQMMHHPLTDNGLDAFLKDWEETGQTILS
jgi:transaldolase